MAPDIEFLRNLPANGNLTRPDRLLLQALYDRSMNSLHGISAVMPRLNICVAGCKDQHNMSKIRAVIASTELMLKIIDQLP